MSSRSSRQSKNKLVNPTFFVFCEGETEEAFVSHLRTKYRLSIVIKPKIAGCDISGRKIANIKKQHSTHPKDKDYLLYDLDRKDTVERLQKINATLIGSNPCIELWFLLHCCSQNSTISTDECLKKLKQNIKQYKKGAIDDALKKKMAETECRNKAAERAKSLKWPENPSTNVHQIIEDLEHVRKNVMGK
jgi:hypothetical protein